MSKPSQRQALIDMIAAYWSRWITARRLANLRKADPQRMAALERLAAVGGFNLQLDER